MKNFLKALSQNLTLVLLVSGIVFALNVLAVNFPKRLDMTEEKEFTLSGAAKDVLGKLQDRLTIKLYYSKDLPAQLAQVQESAADTLEELKAHAAKPILIESADPDSNEMKEQETLALGISPLQVNIVAKDKRELKKIYMGMALYYQDKKEVIPVVAQVQNLEYEIALSILKMTEKQLPRVGVVAPGDELGDSQYRLLPQALKQIVGIEELGYDAKDLEKKGLKSLLVLDPREVSKEFTRELDNLLSLGANVMIFAGRSDISENLAPSAVETGLEDWLAQKGVGLSEKLLLDTAQNAQAGFNTGRMQVFMPYPFWVKSYQGDLNREHPITSELEETLMPWTGVVEKKDAPDSPWQMTPLVSSSKTSFLQQDGMPGVSPQYVEEMSAMPEFGARPISVILENAKDEKSGRIFLTANFNIVRDQFLQQDASNAIFLQNMIEYTSWGKSLIGIRSRGKTSRPLADVSEGTKAAIKWGHMAGVPVLAVLVGLAGLFIAKKRRQAFISGLTA